MSEQSEGSLSTERLLSEVRGGDHAALNRLLEMHREEVRRIVTQRVNKSIAARTDASDIVQETLMEVAERMPDFIAREPMPFRDWLRCTALDKLRDANRRHLAKGRSVTREIPLEHNSSQMLDQALAASGSTPSGGMKRIEMLHALEKAVEQLPQPDQEIVLMRWVENLPYEQIGLVLELSAAAARQRHGRALARLGQILHQQRFSQNHQ